jgi:hypothetical protein
MREAAQYREFAKYCLAMATRESKVARRRMYLSKARTSNAAAERKELANVVSSKASSLVNQLRQGKPIVWPDGYKGVAPIQVEQEGRRPRAAISGLAEIAAYSLPRGSAGTLFRVAARLQSHALASIASSASTPATRRADRKLISDNTTTATA